MTGTPFMSAGTVCCNCEICIRTCGMDNSLGSLRQQMDASTAAAFYSLLASSIISFAMHGHAVPMRQHVELSKERR